jgi:glutathione S-transferase
MKLANKFIAVALLLTLLIPALRVSAQAPGAATKSNSHLVIYHAESRRSERIVWLCEAVRIPYDLKFRRGDVAGSFADIRHVNPDGCRTDSDLRWSAFNGVWRDHATHPR